MYRIISAVEPYMPADKIRYLMGVGTPGNIIEAVSRGVDLFDCVMPSRNARHGHLFTHQGIININNGLICAIALFQKVLYFSGIIFVIYCMRHLKQVAYSFVNRIEVNHN
jgi:hypothetical protein